MCEYCNSNFGESLNLLHKDFDCYKEDSLKIENNKLKVFFTQKDDYYEGVDDEININYCPMCGSELKEG